MKADCVFCRIVAKQIPASVVFEDQATLAFMDLGQVNPGHVLVASKAHADDIYGLDEAQAAAVFRARSGMPSTRRGCRSTRRTGSRPGRRCSISTCTCCRGTTPTACSWCGR